MHVWNRLIVDHFFHEGRAAQRVRLNVTTDLLVELGRPYGWNQDDFLEAAARGSEALTKRTENVCKYAHQIYRCWRQPNWLPREHRGVPPFVSYLGLFVYLTTLGDDDDRSFHRRLWRHFPLDQRSEPPAWYPEFDRMVDLWAELERWSSQRQRGRLGNFRLLRLGKWAHVSIPQAQAILTDAERQRLPALFAAVGLTPDTPLPAEKLCQVLNDSGSVHLLGRTMRAFHEGGALAADLFDDLRNELRRWDGVPPDEPAHNGSAGTPARRTVELVLFLEPRNGRLTPRMRLETTLEEASEEVRYCGGYRVQDLFGTPGPGWSSPVSDQNGAPFDASRFSWEDDHVWEATGPASPRRLAFTGRSVRIFVPATRFRMGGLVEGDELPASGWCCVATAANTRDRLAGWLTRLPQGSYVEEKGPLPSGWTLYRLASVPSEPKVRQAFPAGAEALASVLRLRGGLRIRRGRSGEYHTFAPPRVELGGERTGVEVRADEVCLTDIGDGVFELPPRARAGEFRIEASRGPELLDSVRVTLVDLAHAGNPMLVRGWADRFGRRQDGAASGWAGGWVEAEKIPAFDFGLVATPGPQANGSLQPEGLGSSAAAPLNDFDWGVHPEAVSDTESPSATSEVGSYPLRYFLDLWLLNTRCSPEMRRDAAKRIWEFHLTHGLFQPTAGLSLARLQQLPKQSQTIKFSGTTNENHQHSFQYSGPVPSDLESFVGQVGAEEFYLVVDAASGDHFPQTEGPPYHGRAGSFPTNKGGRFAHQFEIRGTRSAYYYPNGYELGRLPEETGWNVGRKRWNATHGRWGYPWCCDSRGPLLVRAWTGPELAEHLRLRDWLVKEGSSVAAPESVDWPSGLDSYLFDQSELGPVHRRILEPPPLQMSTLRIGGVNYTAMRPAYTDAPPAAKLAWRLAWVDRLAAWEGRGAAFSSAADADSLLPFLVALRAARSDPTDFAKLLSSCFAIAEYLLTLLRRGGIGPAFGFLP